jgi:hypothetical protein
LYDYTASDWVEKSSGVPPNDFSYTITLAGGKYLLSITLPSGILDQDADEFRTKYIPGDKPLRVKLVDSSDFTISYTNAAEAIGSIKTKGFDPFFTDNLHVPGHLYRLE